MQMTLDLLEDRRARRERAWRRRRMARAIIGWALAWAGVVLCASVIAWTFYGFIFL